MTRRSRPGGPRSALGAEFEVILEAAQNGASWACTRIYESLVPSVAGYLRVEGADDPDDLASEVFLRVFSGCRSVFRRRIAVSSLGLHHRPWPGGRRPPDKEQAPDVGVLECLDGQGPTTAGAEEEAMKRLGLIEVHRLLAALTPEQRDVLALRLIAEMSVEEVANALQKPPGAVKALQRRALATLRRTVGVGAARR